MIKVGDLVKITNGSQAARMDKYQEYTSIGLCRNTYLVIFVDPCKHVQHATGSVCHDIHIKNTSTGAIYLHSSSMVRKVEKKRKIKIGDVETEISEDSYRALYESMRDEMKIKTGDTVEVLQGQDCQDCHDLCWAEPMDAFVGKITQVTDTCEDGFYDIAVDDEQYSWHPSWLRKI